MVYLCIYLVTNDLEVVFFFVVRAESIRLRALKLALRRAESICWMSRIIRCHTIALNAIYLTHPQQQKQAKKNTKTAGRHDSRRLSYKATAINQTNFEHFAREFKSRGEESEKAHL